MDLLAAVRRAIHVSGLIRPGDRVLVGISGGPDSTALAHLLLQLRSELRIWLGLVHLDHQLRPGSGEDAAAVARLGETWHVPTVVVRRNVAEAIARHGWSLEDGARRIRYEVFAEAAAARSANRIALAHTADDQAETVLMRLLRGAGLTGLAGIPAARPLGAVTVVRPLLGVWKQDVLAYLRDHRLAWRHDATNADPTLTRSRIRTQLLPWLERSFNSNLKAGLVQLAGQCERDLASRHAAAARQWKRLVKVRDGGVAIRIAGFLRQPKALQCQLVRMAIREVQGDLTGFEFRHWHEVERLLLDCPRGSQLSLPGGIELAYDGEWLAVRRAGSPVSSPSPLRKDLSVPSNQQYTAADMSTTQRSLCDHAATS